MGAQNAKENSIMAKKKTTATKQPRKAEKPRKKATKLSIDTVVDLRPQYPETAEGNARAIDDERRADYAERIKTAWRKSVEAIIETGRLLIEAKEELGYGPWTTLVVEDLGFSERTANRLVAIADHALLRTHVSVLPAAWGTLYQLTRLPEPLLLTKIETGKLTPETERQHVAGWLKEEEEKEKEKARKEAEEKARGNGGGAEDNKDGGGAENGGGAEDNKDGGDAGDNTIKDTWPTQPDPVEPDPWADFERGVNTIGQLRDYINEAIKKRGAKPNNHVWLDDGRGLHYVSVRFVEDEDPDEPPMMVITTEDEDAEQVGGQPAHTMRATTNEAPAASTTARVLDLEEKLASGGCIR
jgi:hypothetical protein